MKTLVVSTIALFFVLTSVFATEKDGNNLQRLSKGVFDVQENTVSNFEFKITNYGIFGNNDTLGVGGGGIWPRGSQNQYIYGGGFWFGAKKTVDGTITQSTIVEQSYNPNTGRSWFVPGRIEDGLFIAKEEKKYRVYFSTDFDLATGQPALSSDGTAWPLWITDKEKKYSYGTYLNKYEHDENKRNTTDNPLGPLFVSDEDIVSTYKDTDFNFYEGDMKKLLESGYPLKVQAESSIYSWGEGDMYDIVIQSYVLENKSTNTLSDCWFAGLYDTDIALKSSGSFGAGNDRAKYFQDDESLNLAVAWTNSDRGEEGKGFGYFGLTILESPAVDSMNNIRNDKLIFSLDEQLGMTIFRNWNIDYEPKTIQDKYDWISGAALDGDTGPGDKRMLVSTGPFNMKPGDKARVAYALAFAMPAKGGEADGTVEDIAGLSGKSNKGDGVDLQSTGNSLIDKVKRTYSNYYNGIAMSARSAEPNLFDANVYPNPANDIATFDYTIKTAGNYSISILDNQGKEVAKVFSGNRNEGNYHHFIELSKYNLSNGMYFIKIDNGSNFSVKKMMVIN